MSNLLLKTSLVISVLGIIILLVLNQTIPPIKAKIKDLDNSQLNKKVQISGKITNQRDYNTFKIITLDDSTGKISVLINQKIYLSTTNNVLVIGRLTEYKDDLEIQAETIKILSLT